MELERSHHDREVKSPHWGLLSKGEQVILGRHLWLPVFFLTGLHPRRTTLIYLVTVPKSEKLPNGKTHVILANPFSLERDVPLKSILLL